MKKKTCLHCGNIIERRVSTAKFCMDCIDWGKRHPLAGIAHLDVAWAVFCGELPSVQSLDCVDCGAPATDYDHRDYLRPLDVEPVCRSCNCMRGAAHPYKNEPNAVRLANKRAKMRNNPRWALAKLTKLNEAL